MVPIIKGIFAPIPTPFVDDQIAWDKLKDNLAKWGKSSLAGLVVLGSNGEFALLSYEEKVAMVRFVRENLPKDKLVIAGTGCETTAETIRLTKDCAAAGADAALVINPSFYKGSYTDAVLKVHYTAVADASPVPLMVYNMPRNTGMNLSSQLVIELSKHPNIVGVKDSSGNIVQIAEICAGTADDFAVFAGSGSFLLATLAVGGVGGTLAVANIMPEESVKLVDLFYGGNMEEAQAMQRLLLAPNAAVTAKFGISGLKSALDYLGYYGGNVRPPLLPLTQPEVEKLHEILRQAGL